MIPRRASAQCRSVEHPHIVLLSTGASKPFRRAKSPSGILKLITKGDRQLAVGSVRSVCEDQCLALPIGRSLESHVKRLAIHSDAEMYCNRRLTMLDVYKPALNDRRDNCTEYRCSNVQSPFAGEIWLLHLISSKTSMRFAKSVRALVRQPNDHVHRAPDALWKSIAKPASRAPAQQC
jgi:hypothetical protein